MPHPPDTVARLEAELGATRLSRDVALAPLTTFRIGGPAELFYRARTPDEMVRAVQAANDVGMPVFVLGKGANILVGDGGIPGLVVRCRIRDVEMLEGNRVRAGSGVLVFPELIDPTVAAGLGGLHHFAGIPSTVGGALWQNLHFLSPAPERARTVFIEEVLESAEILTESGERTTVPVSYFDFGYDRSVLHRTRDVVLTATFALDPAPPDELRRIASENLEWRAARHPDLWLYPSAGSVFKKIEGVGAGRLIDECGLKGRTRGGAQISPKHANFIVNMGGATAADVRALIDVARETVLRETGHELVPEISVVGAA